MPYIEKRRAIRKTWLSQKPRPIASLVTAWSLLLLLLGSVAYWKNLGHASTWMAASFKSVFDEHHYLQLWTTLFVHGDAGHLLSNSLTFFVMGYFLAGYFSLWLFPVLAFLSGGLINALVLQGYPPDVKLIGVSGVVYWMAGAWLVLYFLLDQSRSILQRVLRATGVALGIFFPTSAFDPSISYMAHLIGFVLGSLSGGIYYLLNRTKFLSAVVVEEWFEEAPLLEEVE